MDSRLRFLTAMRAGGVPDRVPAAPDISNYIPCRRTGRPFWEIYFEGKIPLWKAYLDAADYFGIDAWMASCTGAPFTHDECRGESKTELVFDKGQDAMIAKTSWKTRCTSACTAGSAEASPAVTRSRAARAWARRGSARNRSDFHPSGHAPSNRSPVSRQRSTEPKPSRAAGSLSAR